MASYSLSNEYTSADNELNNLSNAILGHIDPLYERDELKNYEMSSYCSIIMKNINKRIFFNQPCLFDDKYSKFNWIGQFKNEFKKAEIKYKNKIIQLQIDHIRIIKLKLILIEKLLNPKNKYYIMVLKKY